MSMYLCRGAACQFRFVSSARDLHPFHMSAEAQVNQDPRQVAAGITDQVESEMGTKACAAGFWQSVCGGSVGGEV